MMKEINTFKEFEEELHQPTTIADFFASWCGQCKGVDSLLGKLEEEHPEAHIIKINIEKRDGLKLAARYEAMSLPALIRFEGNEPKEKRFGSLSYDELVKLLK